MKKLLIALVLAGSVAAVAADAPAAAPAAAAAAAPAAAAPDAKPGPRASRRPPLTDEQRAQMRARREKFMAERRAAMEAKALPIIKKYGLDDEKAKALFEELQQAMRSAPMRPSRRGPGSRNMPRPAAPAAAPDAK